jgi:hypothetical protein
MKKLLIGLAIAALVLFAGCFPAGLMLLPTFLQACGFDVGIGAKMFVGEGVLSGSSRHNPDMHSLMQLKSRDFPILC